jgi:preprotein translocase subunit SecA
MEAGILSRQVESAQKKVEELAFSARKDVLKYDDVLNIQRAVIYRQRQRVLEGEDLSTDVQAAVTELVSSAVNSHTDTDYAEEWDLEGLRRELGSLYDTEILVEEITGLEREELLREVIEDTLDALVTKEELMGAPNMRNVERYLMLTTVDTRWREHLEAMEYLRQGIHLRSMAQKNPLVEYRHEGHVMFEDLGRAIREEVGRVILMMKVETTEIAAATAYTEAQAEGQTRAGAGLAAGLAALEAEALEGIEKVGRNAPCPCGSGKKYKKCHGALASSPAVGTQVAAQSQSKGF